MVTLSADPELAAQARVRIGERGDLEAGELQDRWLPLVADTSDDREARELHRWLETLHGVDQVDVVMVGFEEPNS